jgi:hypothetical protein
VIHDKGFSFGIIVLIVGAASFVAVFALPTDVLIAVALIVALVIAVILYPKLSPSERSASVLASDKIALPSIAELLKSVDDYEGAERKLATENQRSAVARLGFGPPPQQLFRDEAHALLSARNYSEGVLHRIGKSIESHASRQILTGLITFIVTDPALRQRAVDWSSRSFVRGGAEFASSKQDEHWDKVVGEAKRLGRLFSP